MLYIYHCTYCGAEKRLRVNASPSVARAIGRRCDECGQVWERNPIPEMAPDTMSNPLGELITPFGVLEPSLVRKVESIERQCVEAIKACQNHQPPRCDCWVEARVYCHHVWSREGERSALGYRCSQLWDLLESEERKPRDKRDVYDSSPYVGPVFSDGMRPTEFTEQKLKK